ncbi:MAG TPA: hypothetical protein VMV02_06845 [Acidimicrobiales bacterium]|nr:hypothetical protein [Acidimicrobiales bacterium]
MELHDEDVAQSSPEYPQTRAFRQELTRPLVNGGRKEGRGVCVGPPRCEAARASNARDRHQQLIVEATNAVDVLGRVPQVVPGEQGASHDDHDVLLVTRLEASRDLGKQ